MQRIHSGDIECKQVPKGFFQVEEVLDHRRHAVGRGKAKKVVTEYLVRWTGFGLSRDTWEPESNLSDDINAECAEKLKNWLTHSSTISWQNWVNIGSGNDLLPLSQLLHPNGWRIPCRDPLRWYRVQTGTKGGSFSSRGSSWSLTATASEWLENTMQGIHSGDIECKQVPKGDLFQVKEVLDRRRRAVGRGKTKKSCHWIFGSVDRVSAPQGIHGSQNPIYLMT